MTNNSKVLVVIPARGGSKRLPRKNIKPLHGKPVIGWTIEAACRAKLDARIMVTSDDEEILDYAERFLDQGVIAHRRPDELATDTASSIDVVIEAIEADRRAGGQSSTIVLLQPTSPLRTESDIRQALTLFRNSGESDTVVSVCEVDHPTAWVGQVKEDNFFTGLELLNQRSQEHKKEYRLNGAVYVVSVEHLLTQRSLFTEKLLASVMPRIRSIDIDEAIDFEVCEALMRARLR